MLVQRCSSCDAAAGCAAHAPGTWLQGSSPGCSMPGATLTACPPHVPCPPLQPRGAAGLLPGGAHRRAADLEGLPAGGQQAGGRGGTRHQALGIRSRVLACQGGRAGDALGDAFGASVPSTVMLQGVAHARLSHTPLLPARPALHPTSCHLSPLLTLNPNLPPPTCLFLPSSWSTPRCPSGNTATSSWARRRRRRTSRNCCCSFHWEQPCWGWRRRSCRARRAWPMPRLASCTRCRCGGPGGLAAWQLDRRVGCWVPKQSEQLCLHPQLGIAFLAGVDAWRLTTPLLRSCWPPLTRTPPPLRA